MWLNYSEGPASTLSGFPLLFSGAFVVVCVTGVLYFQWWLKLRSSGFWAWFHLSWHMDLLHLLFRNIHAFLYFLRLPTAVGWVKLEGPSLNQYLFSEDGQGKMTQEGCGKRANVVRLPQNTLQAPGICGSGNSWARDGAFVFNSSDGFFFCDFVCECFLMQVNLWYPTTSCGKGLAGFTVT